jgi:uncharacterized protein GlcG (DUF336 family)
MISLKQAQSAVNAALRCGVESNLKPLAVMVMDAGGHPVAFARQDGATFFRHEIARAKAIGALGMGADTRVLAERASNNATFYQSVSVVVGGDIAFSPGGVLICDDSGTVIGAIGISGDTGQMDEVCALAGIAAAGWKSLAEATAGKI